MSLMSRLTRSWNAFMNKDPTVPVNGSSYRADRNRYYGSIDKSMINAVITRIAVDAASITIRHVLTDKDGRYLSDIDSELNYCLNTEANIDQTGRAFLQDAYITMLSEGCCAIVPIDTDPNPRNTDSYKIYSMRVGKVIEWYPRDVKVRIYNDVTGEKEDVIVPKRICCIVENPFYSVMNEPNGTAQRLIRTLNALDSVINETGARRLDIIVQLPYAVKNLNRKTQAEERRKDLEEQLSNSKIGVAYTDGTEKVIQLNRPIENQLMEQSEKLLSLFYSQLCITKEIMEGTAPEEVMTNYFNRTIEVIVSAIVDEMKRKFLSKTARTRHQSIKMFRDPFRLVPVSSMAEIADKMTRNEIMTSNEVRQSMGMKPSNDPNADILRNKNLSEPSGGNEDHYDQSENEKNDEREENQNEV